MRIDRKQGGVQVTMYRDFNLHVKQQLESLLNPSDQSLKVDMSACKLIDSEGVIFLHRWMAAGKKLELVNPPAILKQILHILEIDHALDWPLILEQISDYKQVSS